MSTTIEVPVSPEKKKKKDKAIKKTDAPADQISKANAFSDMLIGSPRPVQASKEASVGRESSPKKRRHEETEAEPVTATPEREESPKKKRKDAHNQIDRAPKVNSINLPNGYLLSTSPSKATSTHRDFTEESTRRIHKSPAEVDKQGSAKNPTSKASRESVLPGLPTQLESPFVSVKASFKVTIPPVAQMYPLEGALAHYISPLLLTWHPQLDGILLAYNNAKLHSTAPRGPDGMVLEEQAMAQAVDECAAPYVWLTLDTLIFQPKKGLEMEGYINLQNESHITLILWNYFTISISKKRLPKDWVWQDAYAESAEASDPEDKPMRRETEQWGGWYDVNGNDIQGSLRFRVKDWDCAPPGSNGEGSFLSIEGTMLNDEQEEELRIELAEEARLRRERSSTPRVRTPLQSALKKKEDAQTPTGGKKAKKSAKS